MRELLGLLDLVKDINFKIKKILYVIIIYKIKILVNTTYKLLIVWL